MLPGPEKGPCHCPVRGPVPERLGGWETEVCTSSQAQPGTVRSRDMTGGGLWDAG